MEENRKIVYYLEVLGNANLLERSIAKLNGVLSVRVDEQNSLLEYTIDEWASDYDVFTEVMRICSECGAAIDFDKRVEEECELLNEEESVDEEQVVQAEVEEVEENSSNGKKEKKNGGLSERTQRFIELGVAIAAYIVGLFLTGTTQYMFFAVSFAFAGYDALYEAFVKITKKQIFSEELLISLAFIGSILLGYTSFAVIGLLLYSTVSFARSIIREEIEKNPAFAKQEQKIALASEAGVKNVSYAQIKVGDSVVLYGGSVSAFDGELQNDCDVEDFKGAVRSLKSGEEIYAGEKLLSDAQIKITALEEDCRFG
jgi:cation transport ATPase